MDFSEQMLALLPRESRAKLDAIMIERDAGRAAYLAASDAWQAARHEHGLLEARVKDQLGGFQGYEALAPGEAFRRGAADRAKGEAEERLMQPVHTAKRRLDLAAAAREKAAERQSSFAYLEGVAAWLQRASSFGISRLEHHAPAAPKVKSIPAEIDRLRAQLAELDEAWQQAESAPAPAEVLRRQAIAEIEAVAERGALTVSAGDRSGTPLGLARKLHQGLAPVPGQEGAPRFSIVGDGGGSVFVWAMRDVLVERVDALIADLPQEGAMDDDERDAEFGRIAKRKLEIERVEEALVLLAEAEGRIVQRRRDADPRALLEVEEA